MSTATTIKLVKPDPIEHDTIPLDRRVSARHVISGRVTALQAGSEDHHPNRRKICSLQLINISETGLGALSQEPIELDTSITIFFPPHGPERGFDKYGRIVRCIGRDGRQEIGIQFDTRVAA